MQKRKLIVVAILFGLVQTTMAQAITADSVLGLIQQGMGPAVSRLTSTAISWLGVFAVIQFVITNYGLLKSDGDLQAVIAKATASITWIGVCLYIINNGPEFIQGVGDEMMGIVGFDLPSASGVIAQTVKLSSITAGIAVAASAAPFIGDTLGTLILYVALGLLIVGLLFAFKVFMLQLELGLIALLAPLSFAFLGLSTLKDQGIAPFKSLLSFSYRAIILTVILSAFGQINDALSDAISNISVSTIKSQGIGNVIEIILSSMGAYILLAFLVWKSDSLASSLASGSTSLGNSDIASAAAAGAAAGAVVASGGAAAAAGAGKAPQAMSDFMSSLSGGGSIKNVGGMGGGGASPTPFVPPTPPSMSRTGENSGSSGASGKSSATSSTNAYPKGQAGSEKPLTGTPSGNSSSVASSRYGADTANSSSQGEQFSPSSGESMNISPAGASAQTHSDQNITGNSSPAADSAPAKPQTSSSSADAAGSGRSAGIGSNNSLQQTLDRLNDSLSRQQNPQKPTLKDHLNHANQQVERERDSTNVQISTLHHD